MKKDKQKDSTPKNGVQQAESTQERFLMAGVGVFLKNGELSKMTIQNDYGAIVLTRSESGKTITRAIGFVMPEDDEDDGEDFDDYEDYEENEQDEQAAINKFVRWL